MEIHISEMTTTDYDDVLDLWRSTENVGLSGADTKENIHAYLHRNPELSLVARHEGRVIAAVLCGHDGRRGYLHHLAVAPEHRKQGLGSSLVERCLSKLGSLGIQKCNIFVYGKNDEGSEFWRRSGWRERKDLKLMQRKIPSRSAIDEPNDFFEKMVALVGGREPLDVLAATPAVLRQIVEQYTVSDLRCRPYPGKWTPNEILGHLVDHEIVSGFRFRSVLFGDEPVLQGYPQEQWVSGQNHQEGDLVEFLTTFQALRHLHLRLWRGLGENALKKVGHRADRGKESVALMLRTMAGHDLSHIDQMQRYSAAARQKNASKP